MKPTHQHQEHHDLVEVMSEGLIATLIISLSLAATLVAVLMVIG